MNELKELMLRAPKLTLAVAESMTAGRLQARVGAISGASNFFLGGITGYNLDQKVKHLGVDRAAAAAVDCVSAGVAEQMARGVCALFGAELGIGTTGYAEASADPVVADPFAWWAIAWRQSDGSSKMRSGRIDCPGLSRVAAQERVADAALKALVEWLKTERHPAAFP
jgi:nicotinamide-nucleotide amidase